jgi:hypothetical protein
MASRKVPAIEPTSSSSVPISAHQWLTLLPKLDSKLSARAKRDRAGPGTDGESCFFTFLVSFVRLCMKHFDFPHRFRTVYEKAVALYAEGKRGADTFFTTEEKAFLAANGLTPQHIYDYAEDHNGYDGEPGLEQALGIELVRRDYFLNAQAGRASTKILDETKLPAKADAVRGISWLPRILPKARAKLQGELPPSLMYCCGGDRKFFEEHDILPAEFLSLVWRHGNDDAPIVDWVVRRSAGRRREEAVGK